MACNLTKGRILPCNDAIGGILGIYFIDYGTITPAYDLTNTNVLEDLGVVTAYKYDVKSASGLEQTMNSPEGQGVTFVDQVLTVILQRMEFSTNAELKLLAYGRPHIAVHYKTGETVLVGVEFGASLETGVASSGQAAGDLQGYTLTINGQERCYANYLEGSTIADPFVGMTNIVTVVEGSEVPAP